MRSADIAATARNIAQPRHARRLRQETTTAKTLVGTTYRGWHSARLDLAFNVQSASPAIPHTRPGYALAAPPAPPAYRKKSQPESPNVGRHKQYYASAASALLAEIAHRSLAHPAGLESSSRHSHAYPVCLHPLSVRHSGDWPLCQGFWD